MKMIAGTVFLLVALFFDVAVSFSGSPSTRIITNRMTMGIEEDAAWDGKRTPVTNMMRLEQAMDASWGRGKFRTEVWAGDVNPINDWWVAYAPSTEEIDASAKGFNFKDPKAWFEAHGVDADAAVAEGKKVKNERFAAYLEAKTSEKAPTPEEFEAMKLEFLALNKKLFEASFRMRDNIAQAAKGQPSLDNEDTGKQWKNDKK